MTTLRTDYTNDTLSADTHPAAHNDVNAQVNALATVAQRGANFGEDPLTFGLPVMDRRYLNTSALIGNGRMELFYLRAPVDVTATKMRVVNGTAAAAGLTLARLAIYEESPADGALTLVGATPNDLTLFAATNTTYTSNLQAAAALVAGRRYALALLCTGTTMPNVAATTAQTWNGPLFGLAPKVAAYRTPNVTDLPATIAPSELSLTAVCMHYLVAVP